MKKIIFRLVLIAALVLYPVIAILHVVFADQELTTDGNIGVFRDPITGQTGLDVPGVKMLTDGSQADPSTNEDQVVVTNYDYGYDSFGYRANHASDRKTSNPSTDTDATLTSP